MGSVSGKLLGETKMEIDANISVERIITRLPTKHKEIKEKRGNVTPESLKNAFFGIEELLVLMDK